MNRRLAMARDPLGMLPPNNHQPSSATASKRLHLVPRYRERLTSKVRQLVPSGLSFQAKAARLARMTIASSMRASVLSHGDDAFGAFGGLARNPNFWRAITRLAAGVRLEASPPQAVLVDSLACRAGICMTRYDHFFHPSLKNTIVRIGANGGAARHRSTPSFQ